jgi:hypothetical protein
MDTEEGIQNVLDEAAKREEDFKFIEPLFSKDF